MATFTAKKLDLTKVNGGQEYGQGDFLQSDTINDVVEGTAYAQNVAEEANNKSDKAVSTANSAKSTANAASTKVDTFDQRITTAQNTADTAVSNAATAQSTADSATTEINKIKNGTTVVPNANHANNADNADLATKAKQDVNGNSIVDTYATKNEVAEKQGTKVYYGSALQTSVTFDSDPQTQIDNVSNFAVPSSVTDTSRDSGLWVVGTGGTPVSGKTMLLGTFSIYDTNIWLHISGGTARGGSSNDTTDANVFISSLQGTVNEAYCYVRKLYTSNRTQGIYYTVDSSRFLRIFAAVPQYGKLFVSAEVSGGSIAGRGSSEDSYPSGGQYIPEKNYADLSQVVRTDAAQSLTDEQKQQAQNNIAITVTKAAATSGEQTGWWRVAQISNNNVYDIKLKQTYNTNFPAQMNVVASVGYMNDANAILSLVGGYLPNRFVPSKIRVCGNTTACYIDIYTADAAWNTTTIEIKGASGSSISQTEFSFVGTSDTVDGYNVVILDLVSGTNTTGGVYQKGSPVFATDPSKLEPSTANGWTQTTATGTLPSAGVYLVGATVDDNGTSRILSPCIMVFDGTNPAIVLSIVLVAQVHFAYTPSVSTKKWIALDAVNATEYDITNVYYKRIA